MKPQRFGRAATRPLTDENVASTAGGPKILHGRYRSTGTLPTLSTVTGLNGVAKRSAFGDVPANMKRTMARDDSLIGTRSPAKAAIQRGDRTEGTSLLRRAQRGQHDGAIKAGSDQTNSDVVDLAGESQQLPHIAPLAYRVGPKRPGPVKRDTMVYRDGEETNDVVGVEGVPATILEAGDDIELTNWDFKAIGGQGTTLEEAKSDADVEGNSGDDKKKTGENSTDGAVLPTLLPAENTAVRNAAENEDDVAPVEANRAQLQAAVMRAQVTHVHVRTNIADPRIISTIDSSLGSQQQQQLPDIVNSINGASPTIAQGDGSLHQGVAENLADHPMAPELNRHGVAEHDDDGLELTQYHHEEDEGYEDDGEDGEYDLEEDEAGGPYMVADDGFTTAPSFMWRPRMTDNLTTGGGQTVVMLPHVSAKDKRDMAAAKRLVESTRTVQQIEDDLFDPSMAAEYIDEIFDYLAYLEVSWGLYYSSLLLNLHRSSAFLPLRLRGILESFSFIRVVYSVVYSRRG